MRNFKNDDAHNIDGRLIHRAAGVLDAASLANTFAEDHKPGSKTRRALDRLSDTLRDVAWEMRQHHNELTARTRRPTPVTTEGGGDA